MAMLGSKEKWNAKYSAKTSFSIDPDEFLIDHISIFKEGSVLDVACGTGRNSIWLAKEGFSVTGVDISDIGLSQLETSAKKNQVTIKTIAMDLTDPQALRNLETYDNMIVSRYKPSKEILLTLPLLLNEGGILLLYTHNWKQVAAGKFKQQFCLTPNELVDLPWEMKLLTHTSFELDAGFYDGYIFSKDTNP
jgi:2-polyprenyl-3-methyl-5-hydroxy-6-metoxy-1,4-benzoquinol methylase